MLDIFKKDGEKKVEYIELIYDLIFVYILGRNNSIIHTIKNGFIEPHAFLTYIISTFVILQIWYSTVLFINKYGENGLQENIAIFINMYLLYYMAEGTRTQWQDYYVRYNAAWLLILVNLTLQYYLKYRKTAKTAPWVSAHLKRNMGIMIIQIIIIAVSFPVFIFFGFPLAPAAMVFGIIAVMFGKGVNMLVEGDFAHLTERIMLYVVFTFGEMIIAVAEYFEGGFNFNTVYFSICAFLLVAGLFISYGFFYDNIIDREGSYTGTKYMIIHVFLITALNNITVALEFMRNEKISAIPKNLFIAASMIAYFIFLFLLEKYAIVRCKGSKKFFAVIIIMSIVFAALVMTFYKNGYVSIGITVLYIYSVFGYLYLNYKKTQKAFKNAEKEI